MPQQTSSLQVAAQGSATIYRKPLISFHGIRKSYRYLGLFVFDFSPLYGCSPPEFLTLYAPYVTLIESLVYQSDIELEEAQRGDRTFAEIETWLQKKTAIIELLQELGFADATFDGLLDNLSQYWTVENEINYQKKLTPASLRRAVALRASDFHAVHYLCLRMANPPQWEAIFAALFPLAIYRDLFFDLVEYQKDVNKNNYNSYRGMVKLYGSDAKQHMQEEMDNYQNQFEEKLKQLSDDVKSKFHRISQDFRERNSLPIIPEPILE